MLIKINFIKCRIEYTPIFYYLRFNVQQINSQLFNTKNILPIFISSLKKYLLRTVDYCLVFKFSTDYVTFCYLNKNQFNFIFFFSDVCI